MKGRFKQLRTKNLIAATLTAIGVAASFSLLEPLYSNTMNISPAILLLPTGLLLLSNSPGALRGVRIAIYAAAGILVLYTAGMTLALTVFDVPRSEQFSEMLASPWYWVQILGTTALLVASLMFVAELIRRIAEQPLREGPAHS